MKICKNYLSIAFIVFVVFLYSPQNAYCLDVSSKEVVRNFYKWYIPKIFDKKDAFFNDEIYKYVWACTVEKLRLDRKRATLGCDFFTASQDFDDKHGLDTMMIYNPIPINKNTSVVCVDFYKMFGNESLSLAVFVEKKKGSFFITKVESLRDHY